MAQTLGDPPAAAYSRPVPGAGSATKAALRAEVLARRAARPEATRQADARGLTRQVLALPQVAAAASVAAYVAGPGEPETRDLLDSLLRRGTTVLLPVLCDDFDLDWAPFGGFDDLQAGRFGIWEPGAARLGRQAIGNAEVVLCPGVAGDLAGRRLGRGGGSYDRVLARVLPGVLRCLLLHDDELVNVVPVDAHDEPVGVIITPTRVLTTSAGGG